MYTENEPKMSFKYTMVYNTYLEYTYILYDYNNITNKYFIGI